MTTEEKTEYNNKNASQMRKHRNNMSIDHATQVKKLRNNMENLCF